MQQRWRNPFEIENALNYLRLTLNINSQKYPLYTEYIFPRPKFHSISLYNEPFRNTKSQIETALNSPRNDLNCLTVKSTLCTLDTQPRLSYCDPFHSTTSGVRNKRLLKIGNAPNDPGMTLTTFKCQKYPVHTEYQPRGPNFTPFRSTTRPSVFEIQGCQISEMHRMPPKWP